MKVLQNINELKSLNKYLKRYKSSVILGGLFVVASNLFAVIPAKLFGKALDTVAIEIEKLKLNPKNLMGSEFSITIVKYSILILLMAILRGVFMFLMRQTIIVMSRKIEYDLKNDLFKHILSLHNGFFKSYRTGDILSRISEDVGRVRMYLGPAIMYAINILFLIVLTVSIMLSVNVELTLMVLIPLPILAFTIYRVNKITYQKSTLLQDKLSKITTFVQETFSGIRVVKSFATEKSISKLFSQKADDYQEIALSVAKTEAFFTPSIVFMISISSLITLLAGGYQVMQGNISIGNMGEFFIYVNQLTWPVASIGWTTNLIQRAAASQKRINEVMNIQPEISAKEDDSFVLEGVLSFQNVSFTYPDTGIQAVKDVSFDVNKGASIGIIGDTGSGKTTLAKLILRLIDAQKGNILIDGKSIKEVPLQSFRKKLGYVPQDDFLFSDSITNNILCGKTDEFTKGNVLNSSKITAFYEDVMGFSDGYETIIGERGITLSGGQKQRLSLTRALVSNPTFLILDDCFSAIDTATESKILNNLSQVLGDKTTLMISHRVSTIKNCDMILVLSDGEIIERGSHNELITYEGYYYSLYQKQLNKQKMKDLVEKET